MKIFTPSDIREIDRLSAEKEKITSYDLMERAASAVSYEVMSRWLPSQRIVIFAGPGNNGGDALAVARHLIDQGYKPKILLLNTKGRLSADCAKNRQRITDYGYDDFVEVTKSLDMPDLSESDVIIDGLFGSGLSDSLHGGYIALVRAINESGAFVVSIDMPSGLFSEFNKGNLIRSNVVHANLTFAFQFPRLSFFFAENACALGRWEILDIGLDSEAISSTPSNYFLIDAEGVREALKPRDPFATKDDYGRMVLVAGSLGMMGAAVLSARAAMRAGVGALTVHAPKCGYIVLQTSVPEAMVDMDDNDEYVSSIPRKSKMVYAIGPGIGTDSHTIDALEQFLRQASAPVVLDADALNCIAQRRSLLNDIPRNSIITPHYKEFDRLFGEHFSEEERFMKAVEMAKVLRIVIVMKGHYTKVIRPDGKIFINMNGNSGMATAGSGDVLTGIIASLLAQGYNSCTAASVGVYVHGLAGDIACSVNGEEGLVAGDIADCVGKAFLRIRKNAKLK